MMKLRLTIPAALGAACLAFAALAQSAAELVLPIDPGQAAAGWVFSGAGLRVVQDEVTGAPAFEPDYELRPDQPGKPAELLAAAPLGLPVVVEATVRLPTVVSSLTQGRFSRAMARLGWQSEPAAGGEPVRLAVEVSRGRFRDDRGYEAAFCRGAERAVSRRFAPLYSLDGISPLMDDHVRLILEQRVDRVPLAHERLHRLRLEVRQNLLRCFVNGRLIAEEAGPFGAGRAVLDLRGKARLLAARVFPLAEGGAPFVTVPLDDFFNARGPAGAPGLAPSPGQLANLHGVPFVTSVGARGEDHLSLEPSVYLHRLGSMRAGDSREAVNQPEEVDVTRFTMRVPARTYRRAWVLAAADGDPNHAPVLTLRFYIPRTPWVTDATVEVPTCEATSNPGQARRLAWPQGGPGVNSLWLIPIDLDAAALAVEPMECLELTKAIHPYRGYPDPAYYHSYPGGLPSGVRVYGLTLEEAPLWARGTGAANANLYIGDEPPVWRVLLRNLTAGPLDTAIAVTVTDPYGQTSEHRRQAALAPGGDLQEIVFEPAAPVFGLYTVTTEVSAGDFRQSRQGTFLRLPSNRGRATGANSPWGLWCWNGGHQTNPDSADNLRILKALGAINNFQLSEKRRNAEPVSLYPLRQQFGIGAMHYRLVDRRLPEWSAAEPVDPAAYAAFAEEKGREAAAALAENPDLIFVNFFAENALSLRLTHGMSPWAMGQPWFELDDKERMRLRAHWVTAKAALEGVRRHAPTLKVLFGHGAGNFAQPFFRLPDWDNAMFDGFGMDLPQFERMPERQPRTTEPNLLFFLHRQMQEKGLAGKEVVHLESYFPSSGPLALSFPEQADSVVRTAVLSLALGTTRFMRTWELHTSGDGWGGSHYGSAGLIDRAPEFNPKPAAAAFATMARVLDLARFDGYLDTGSRSTFCVRFRDDGRLVYAVWTIRGSRPLRLDVEPGAGITRTDLHGNSFPVALAEGTASVTLTPTPQWLEVRGGAIRSAVAGQPVHTAAPSPVHRLLDDFNASAWTCDPGPFERYQNNHWDMPREPGKMAWELTAGDGRDSRVLRVRLDEPNPGKPLVGFYGLFSPPQPIAIPGQAAALGLWVNGRSAWNRFIYEVVDAKGETWLSCGTADAWNCDDIHSWSSINHDGWRYLRFPLPATAPGDNFREADTVWWGSDAEGIVDLPLRLTRIIVEMRPQMIYVNELLPIPDLTIELDDLTAEYVSERHLTDEPVRLQAAAATVLVDGQASPLPNPRQVLLETGVGQPPVIADVYPPDQNNNGQRLYVSVEPVPGATRYLGYVSAYPDGRGARALAIDQQAKHAQARSLATPNLLYYDGLQPSRPMYLFVTVLDAQGRESKPSAIRQVILKDEFPFK